METAGPVDGNIGRPSTQLSSGSEGRSGIHTTKIEHVGKDGAILNTIEVIDQMLHIVLIARSDPRSMGPCEEHFEPRFSVKGQNIP